MRTKVTYLGGATYLLEIGSFRILTDPGFDAEGTEKSEGPGHNLKKTMSPPIPVDQIGRIDAVLLSHAHHYDNLDNTAKAMLQLRKRGIDRVILAGMSANLCTESHMRELLEQGFEVLVVSDGTAAAVVPDGDGYAAALTNFRFIANAVRTTEQVATELVGADTAQRFIRESRSEFKN